METNHKPDLIVQNKDLTSMVVTGTDRGLHWLKEAAHTEEPQIVLEAEQGERLCQHARAEGLTVEMNP